MTEGGLFWSKREVKFVTAERLAEIRSYPIKQKLLEAKVWRRLEMLNDEKQIGGWWEHGAWIDGMASGKGTARWIGLQFSLEWEGEEDEVYKLRA